jgi:hypothetical protein
MQRLVDIFETTAVRRQDLRGESLGTAANARSANPDGMAPVGDRSGVVMPVAEAPTDAAALTAQPVQKLVDLGLQDGLDYFADFLATRGLERGQKIFARRLGRRRRLAVHLFHGVSPVWLW